MRIISGSWPGRSRFKAPASRPESTCGLWKVRKNRPVFWRVCPMRSTDPGDCDPAARVWLQQQDVQLVTYDEI